MELRFDRGTLLLEGLPDHVDAHALPGVAWDGRVGAHRAPAFRHRALVDALGERQVDVREPWRAPTVPAEAWSPVDLRSYQSAALTTWQLCGRRGILALPTGSGKTRVALAAMAASGVTALCLVPTRALLAQWHHALSSVYGGRVGCFGDGERELAPVTLATFESAWRHGDVLGRSFGLIVIDEVHHFGRGLRDEALEMNLAPERLGLSATPPRDPIQCARLHELVGPVVYELSVRDLTGSFLAPLQVVGITLDLTRDERERYEADMRTFRGVAAQRQAFVAGATWADLARAMGQTDDGRRALEAWRRARQLVAYTRAKSEVLRTILDRHRDARTLVFTADNVGAYGVARDHLLMPVTCDIGRDERSETLSRFERGELRALVSARVLNEGIDVPAADVAVIVGGAHGEREHVQRVGRLLRPAAGKRALVYELVTRGTSEVAQSRRRRRALAP